MYCMTPCMVWGDTLSTACTCDGAAGILVTRQNQHIHTGAGFIILRTIYWFEIRFSLYFMKDKPAKSGKSRPKFVISAFIKCNKLCLYCIFSFLFTRIVTFHINEKKFQTFGLISTHIRKISSNIYIFLFCYFQIQIYAFQVFFINHTLLHDLTSSTQYYKNISFNSFSLFFLDKNIPILHQYYFIYTIFNYRYFTPWVLYIFSLMCFVQKNTQNCGLIKS